MSHSPILKSGPILIELEKVGRASPRYPVGRHTTRDACGVLAWLGGSRPAPALGTTILKCYKPRFSVLRNFTNMTLKTAHYSTVHTTIFIIVPRFCKSTPDLVTLKLKCKVVTRLSLNQPSFLLLIATVPMTS